MEEAAFRGRARAFTDTFTAVQFFSTAELDVLGHLLHAWMCY